MNGESGKKWKVIKLERINQLLIIDSPKVLISYSYIKTFSYCIVIKFRYRGLQFGRKGGFWFFKKFFGGKEIQNPIKIYK
jgi:hypothetical protein